MKWIALASATVVGVIAVTPSAQAQKYQAEPADEDRLFAHHRAQGGPVRRSRRSVRRAGRTRGSYQVARVVSGVGYRPRRWCGWWMRTQLGGGPEFNVAWNWRKYGSPTGPQVGAVVIWRHHVGIITGQTDDGRWIVKSGNDGGRVRERPRSVRGALFRI